MAANRSGRVRPELTAIAARGFASVRLMGLAAWRGVVEFVNSEGPTHAAAIGYYSLLSLFPFLLLVLSVLGMLTADPADRDAALRFVFQYFPRQFDFITGQLDAFREQTFRLGVGGLLALTWAALGVFNAVSAAIDHAWGVERRRSFLMHRLISFVMMLSAGAIFLVALVLASFARVAETNWFWDVVADSDWTVWMSAVAADWGSTLLLIACVALLYYVVPNTQLRVRDVLPGAILTGILWRIAFSAFAWYARDIARWTAVHGPITTVVVFLFWIYISAVILLYGAEVSAAYARLRAAARRHPELATGGPPPVHAAGTMAG